MLATVFTLSLGSDLHGKDVVEQWIHGGQVVTTCWTTTRAVVERSLNTHHTLAGCRPMLAIVFTLLLGSDLHGSDVVEWWIRGGQVVTACWTTTRAVVEQSLNTMHTLAWCRPMLAIVFKLLLLRDLHAIDVVEQWIHSGQVVTACWTTTRAVVERSLNTHHTLARCRPMLATVFTLSWGSD